MQRIDVRAIARHRADVASGAAQSRDDQEILMPADQRRHRFAPFQHEGGRRRHRRS
jgi:hypothetical protein